MYFMSPQMDIYKALAPHMRDKRVLDVGFGFGFGALQFTPYAASVTGVELDNEAVNFANATIPGVRWEWGDIQRGVHYLGSDYDAVVMIEVLEHISEWQLALLNVQDVLKPGGLFYISARNANADLRKNDLHERELTAKQFKNALSHYFDDVQLWDYKLEIPQGEDTHQTPLIAIATKGRL